MPGKSKQKKTTPAAQATASAAPSKTQEVLKPKKMELKAGLKPSAVLIHSPNDTDPAVKYAKARDFLTDTVGYTVINKGKITWNTTKIDELVKLIKPGKRSSLTVWVDAHGAPGWFFADKKSSDDELKQTVQFALFIQAIKQATGAEVTNIVLSGCYTGAELTNEEGGQFFFSPARMLSLLLPGVNVIGFIGQNANAVVNQVFEKADGIFKPVSVKPEEAAIVFNRGKVMECYTRELYCAHAYTPAFIQELCALDVTEEDFFAPCHKDLFADRTMDMKDAENYGHNQMKFVMTELEKQKVTATTATHSAAGLGSGAATAATHSAAGSGSGAATAATHSAAGSGSGAATVATHSVASSGSSAATAAARAAMAAIRASALNPTAGVGVTTATKAVITIAKDVAPKPPDSPEQDGPGVSP